MLREENALREIYRVVLQPIEKFLVGAEELVIVPHMELFEVPWAALIDAGGRYLIERHVIRVSLSLRVARQAAENKDCDPTPGHVLVVGNPWPNCEGALEGAEKEANSVACKLIKEKLEVRVLVAQNATKTPVKTALQGAGWALFACHRNKFTDCLVLAEPADHENGDISKPNLSMIEVQDGVLLRRGATVVLSACNTGRGNIKAEGVVGLSRGFLSARAAATLVTLWKVSLLPPPPPPPPPLFFFFFVFVFVFVGWYPKMLL